MKNKYIIVVIISIILLLLAAATWYFILYPNMQKKDVKSAEKISENIPATSDKSENSKDNNEIVKTNSKSTIRIINSYDKAMFEGKKCILLMWGSWCPNCAEEFDDLKEILDYYKDTDIKIILVSHDFELDTLVDFVESENINYDTEIYLDLGRIIRKSIDPEASTVPVTYFLDENTTVIKKYNTSITLDKVKEIIKDIGW